VCACVYVYVCMCVCVCVCVCVCLSDSLKPSKRECTTQKLLCLSVCYAYTSECTVNTKYSLIQAGDTTGLKGKCGEGTGAGGNLLSSSITESQ
jgi:hypothetical protein